ncbi:hypothetical protein PEC18_18895 [Paucibacter sp. O1-1]|nr:hypothetical protein [Paucibacter sp. O1-1]MDA3827866.1 hypothetical protein [Paucibacter sp. O1-1]
MKKTMVSGLLALISTVAMAELTRFGRVIQDDLGAGDSVQSWLWLGVAIAVAFGLYRIMKNRSGLSSEATANIAWIAAILLVVFALLAAR